MGFLAPAVPWIIKGGIGIGTALLGKKVAGGGGASSTADIWKQQMEDPYISGSFKDVQGMGKQFLGDYTSNVTPATDFYKALLSGDPKLRRSALAGTLQDIDRTTKATQAAMLTNPNLQRGGAMTTALSGVERAGFGEKARAMTGLEAGAAQALSNIGMQQGQLGQQTTSDLFRNLMYGYQGAQQTSLQQQRLAMEKGQAWGSGIFNILKMIGGGNLKKIWDMIGGIGKGGPPMPPVGEQIPEPYYGTNVDIAKVLGGRYAI